MNAERDTQRIQQRHHDRFRRATTGTIEASSYFLDTIENLRKINSHATGIAYDFVGRRGQLTIDAESGDRPQNSVVRPVCDKRGEKGTIPWAIGEKPGHSNSHLAP